MKIAFVEARKGNQGKKIDLDTVSAVRGRHRAAPKHGLQGADDLSPTALFDCQGTMGEALTKAAAKRLSSTKLLRKLKGEE